MFRIGSTSIVLREGDLSATLADALACPDTIDLTMHTGAAGALLRAGGEELRRMAAEKAPKRPGEAIATEAGALPARWLIHAVTVDERGRSSREIVAAAVNASINEARRLGVKKLAMSAFGTGVGNLPAEDSAAATAAVLSSALADGKGPESITFVFSTGRAHRAFLGAFSTTFGPQAKVAHDGNVVAEGVAALRSGRTIQAFRSFQRAVAEDPENAEAYIYLGEAYERTRDFRAAAQSYEQALSINKDLPEAHLRLGRLMVRDGHLSPARRRLALLAERHPSTGAGEEVAVIDGALKSIRSRSALLAVMGFLFVGGACALAAYHVENEQSIAALIAVSAAVVGAIVTMIGVSGANLSGARGFLGAPPWGAIAPGHGGLPVAHPPADESLPGSMIVFGMLATLVIAGSSLLLVERAPAVVVPPVDTTVVVIDTTTKPPPITEAPPPRVVSNQVVPGAQGRVAITGEVELRGKGLPERGEILVIGRILNAAGVADTLIEYVMPIDSLEQTAPNVWVGKFRMQTSRRYIDINRYIVTAEWQF